jgi:hypothetical protein
LLSSCSNFEQKGNEGNEEVFVGGRGTFGSVRKARSAATKRHVGVTVRPRLENKLVFPWLFAVLTVAALWPKLNASTILNMIHVGSQPA